MKPLEWWRRCRPRRREKEGCGRCVHYSGWAGRSSDQYHHSMNQTTARTLCEPYPDLKRQQDRESPHPEWWPPRSPHRMGGKSKPPVVGCVGYRFLLRLRLGGGWIDRSIQIEDYGWDAKRAVNRRALLLGRSSASQGFAVLALGTNV